MEENSKNCYHQDHSNIKAVFYCIECKIYICNKCENFHSKLYNTHHKYNIDNNKNISEIFTGYCNEKNHSDECMKLHSINKKIETNLIGNYNDYINKCFKYLDSTENYNKKEFTLNLQNIYNENKYDFRLKENIIKNIISRWKTNSLRFTKYSALENRYIKNNELILWE